jgi:hypothetical protein
MRAFSMSPTTAGAFCVGYLTGLIFSILFYFTLHRCLARVKLSNRDMTPGLVWLNLLPCFQIVWIFITVSRIGSSLRKEYKDRDWPTEGEGFGMTVGIAYAMLFLGCHIPFVNLLFAIPWLICWFAYWWQIASYSDRIASEPPPRRRRPVDEDHIFDALDVRPMPVPPTAATRPPVDIDERIWR